MNLSGKRLLIIGGNNIMDEIVDFAEENEVILISAGNQKDAPLHKVSQEQHYVDVTNCELMKQLIQEWHIDGVFSCSGEKVIPFSIKYLTELNMPCYATSEQWDILMNKRRLTDKCKSYGMDVIPEYTLNAQTMDADRPIVYPVVVKPADNGGSSGISVCNSREDLLSAVNLAYQNSKSHEILIQQFIDAPYYQLEVYLQNGKAYLAYTKERIFYEAQQNSPVQPFVDIYPSRHHKRIKAELFPKFSKLLLDIGIINGAVQLQGLMDDEHIYVMDVAYRLSGGMDYRPVQQETGINIVKNHLEYALSGEWNGDFQKCEKPYSHSYATICLGLKNGLIASVEGVEKVKSLDYVYDYFQYYNVGDEMTLSGRFRQTFCRIFIQGGNYKDVMEKCKHAISLLEVKNPKGESLLL